MFSKNRKDAGNAKHGAKAWPSFNLLGGAFFAAWIIKNPLFGWIDLTGGTGGPQPAINFLVTFIIFIGLIPCLFGGMYLICVLADAAFSLFKKK